MKHLKLFEEHKDNDLQKAEDFLDDTFSELMDKWGLCEVNEREDIEDIITNKEKVYCFTKDEDRRNVYLFLICRLDTNISTRKEEYESDIKALFEKVRKSYRTSNMQTNESKMPNSDDEIHHTMVWLNVDNKNDGSF